MEWSSIAWWVSNVLLHHKQIVLRMNSSGWYGLWVFLSVVRFSLIIIFLCSFASWIVRSSKFLKHSPQVWQYIYYFREYVWQYRLWISSSYTSRWQRGQVLCALMWIWWMCRSRSRKLVNWCRQNSQVNMLCSGWSLLCWWSLLSLYRETIAYEWSEIKANEAMALFLSFGWMSHWCYDCDCVLCVCMWNCGILMLILFGTMLVTLFVTAWYIIT